MLNAFSVRLLRLTDFLVNRLAASEALGSVMPVRDPGLAQLPAEQHDLAVHFAGEVEQPDIEILHLDAGGIDFSQSILHARDGLFTLGFAARHVDYVHQQPAAKEDA